jgi:hypothetical protein
MDGHRSTQMISRRLAHGTSMPLRAVVLALVIALTCGAAHAVEHNKATKKTKPVRPAVSVLPVTPVVPVAPITQAKPTFSVLPQQFSGRSIHSTTLNQSHVPVQALDSGVTIKPELASSASATTSNTNPYAGGCKRNAGWVCYDPKNRRAMVPVTRYAMPDLPGVTREGIALRRDRVTFVYSF